MTRVHLGLVLCTCCVVSVGMAGAAVFTEDFDAWPDSSWAQHGSANINVDQTYPGAVYAHGARDFSPAARITHIQTTGVGDFEASFDLRVHGYNGNGRVYIGWMNIDEYASVQDHSTLLDLYGWHMHSSDGTLSSGIWLDLSAAEGGAIQLTAMNEGVVHDWDVSYPGLDDGHLYTITFGRSADQGYLTVFDVDENQWAAPDVSINVPTGAVYDYFQISTTDNMANSWWADFEIDNLSLESDCNGNGIADELEIAAGQAWVERAVQGPGPRSQHSMAYDSARGVAVLFGGWNRESTRIYYTGTWEWNGDIWSLRTSEGPPARLSAAMAYDARRQVTVLFGGLYQGSVQGDMWEWDGETWTQVFPTSGPTAREGARMVYDPGLEVVVLFGGRCGDGSFPTETWAWDGQSWTSLAQTGPSGRRYHGMSYDTQRNRIVIFGGQSEIGGGIVFSDTWEWDGTQWMLVDTGGPGASDGIDLVYSTSRQKTLLFRGHVDVVPYVRNETWEWNGTTWAFVGNEGPAARSHYAMVYDSNRQVPVLFGGTDERDLGNFGDTWESVPVDCNANGTLDVCELSGNDCNANGVPDDCDLSSGVSSDCNGNGIPDTCDIASGASQDENANGVPDECENQPPTAHCQNISRSADSQCQGVVGPGEVDAGSFDPDPGDSITLTLDPPGPYSLGVSTVTLIVTDNRGLTDTCTATITVMDVAAPSLECPADITTECTDSTDPTHTGYPVVSDNCDPDPTITFFDQDAPGSCPQERVITRVWTAADAADNSIACEQTIVVDDSISPEIVCPPDALALECPVDTSVSAQGFATATDNCGAVSVSWSESVSPGCGLTEIITRTWSAVDECVNETACIQTLQTVDTIPPEVIVDDTPIFVVDADCSGEEPVALPTATAEDACEGSLAVSHDGPATFEAGRTTTVTYTAMDGCQNSGSAQLDVTVAYGANIEVRAAKHTVGHGTHPGSTKEPLVGIEVCAYDKSSGSCAWTECGGISHHHYECIAVGDGTAGPCPAINCCTTDANGECTLNLPPGDYVIISADATKTVLPDPLGVSASDLQCGDTMRKYLQQIVRADGKKVPCKTSRHTGSELLIIEPEYIVWDGTVQLYPFVFESVGDWGVTATVAPPEGFVADYDQLSEQVDNELEALQFTITEVGSDLVPTETTFYLTHNGRPRVVRSNIGIQLTPAYARSRGFDVPSLRARGLIMERPGSHEQLPEKWPNRQAP